MKSFKQFITESTFKTEIRTVKLSDLKLNKDGLATAESTFMWEKNPKISNDPVDVNQHPDGTLELMNGYHRYVNAKRNGMKELKAKIRIYDKSLKESLNNCKFFRKDTGACSLHGNCKYIDDQEDCKDYE